MEKSAEIRELVLATFEAAETHDVGFWERHLSEQQGVMVLGTDPSEWWSGRENILKVITPQVEGMRGEFIGSDPQAYSEGTVGWAADQFKWKLPSGKALPMRLAGVFHKESGTWKIVQWVLSIGVLNAEAFG